MHPSTSRRLSAAVAMLLLVAAVWATGVLAIVWAADFDGGDASSSAAAVSGVLLAVGIVVAVVAGMLRRRWGTASLLLVGAGVVAALPWLTLLA